MKNWKFKHDYKQQIKAYKNSTLDLSIYFYLYEGEIAIGTADGVRYTLRFGEVLYGSGDAITAGADDNQDESAGPGENRYLFISVNHDSARFPEPEPPTDTAFRDKAESEWTDDDKANKEREEKHREWQELLERGKQSASDLERRFAKWYYVISAESFDKLHLKRDDVVKAKDS